jgi:RimJ/RimL family protein N-acetyltransferase
MNHELSSGRLSLRPIETAEAADLHRLWMDKRVRHFLWDGKVIPPAQTEEITVKSRRLFEESGFGIWGVHARDADLLIGFAGYWYVRTPPSLELLYGVAADYWNRGIATESSRCVVRYGFEVLGFGRIDASADAENAASVRVMEKLGMAFGKRETVDGLDTVFYALHRNAWQNVNEHSV